MPKPTKTSLKNSQAAANLDSCAKPAARCPAVAAAVQNLKQAALRAFEKRGRLPQPLFWSLFKSRLDSIKATKRRRRLLDSILGGFNTAE